MYSAEAKVWQRQTTKSASFLTIILLLVIFIVGLGLGAESTVAGFKESFRKPLAVICGMASQFGWMPLAAFLLCRAAIWTS